MSQLDNPYNMGHYQSYYTVMYDPYIMDIPISKFDYTNFSENNLMLTSDGIFFWPQNDILLRVLFRHFYLFS